MINKISEILNTLTEEAQNAALEKCSELKFEINRGITGLNEAFINLDTSRSLLMDAIKKKELNHLPAIMQSTLLDCLKAISEFLTKLNGGTDEVTNLVNRIEEFNGLMWQYGIHGFSEEFIDYQTKLDQIKELKLQTTKLKDELDSGLKTKADLDKLLAEAKKAPETLQTTLNSSNEIAKKVSEILAKTTGTDQQIAAKLKVITQNETASNQHLAATKKSSDDVKPLEAKIKEFYNSVAQYQKKIIEIEKNAEKTVGDNKAETNKLISNLKGLEDQIKDQIQKATGHSLFHSFQTRKDKLVKSKRFWEIAIGSLLLTVVGLSVWLVITVTNVDTSFYLKLSISIPLIYAITFCARQYSHERRLEEEYAFKSNISISLMPYKDLVEKIVDKTKPEERAKYTSFIIDSITKVFTSPTDKVFARKEKEKGLDNKTLKKITPLVELISKAIKP